MMVLALLLLFTLLCAGKVVVRQTGQGPTGYEVDFTYTNTSASRVQIGGSLFGLTNENHQSANYAPYWDPDTYQPGDFMFALEQNSNRAPWPYNMTLADPESGLWTYTTPLPSGSFHYVYLVDCPNHARDCAYNAPHRFLDPDNLPPSNVAENANQSTFQVPFNPAFQSAPSNRFTIDYSYQLPVPHTSRGTYSTYNYSSPGSTFPAQDIHSCVIYLPPSYDAHPDTPYPVLYLSHGGGGNAHEWTYLGYAHQIFDNIIHQGHLEPTIVVMPTWDQLDESLPIDPQFPSPIPPVSLIRENYLTHLIPWVETTFPVRRDATGKAFAGLSVGGMLTYEMLINATDQFGYFGIFSGALGANRPLSEYINATMVEERTGLRDGDKGVFVGTGWYDIALPDVLLLKRAFDAAGVRYTARSVVQGSHDFVSWRECLWRFGRETLWKGAEGREGWRGGFD